jgi:hypothetical protein
MSKLMICLAAASSLMLGGAALAQTPPSASQPVNPATPGSATPTMPPASTMPAQPTTPPAAAQPTAPGAPGAPSATPAAPAAAVVTGMTVKDNTGAAIGQISELKPDASGAQMATIKMGTDTFTVAAAALGVQNGAAVINLTQAQLQAQIHKPSA